MYLSVLDKSGGLVAKLIVQIRLAGNDMHHDAYGEGTVIRGIIIHALILYINRQHSYSAGCVWVLLRIQCYRDYRGSVQAALRRAGLFLRAAGSGLLRWVRELGLLWRMDGIRV